MRDNGKLDKSLLVRFRRSTGARRVGKWLERRFKKVIQRIVTWMIPDASSFLMDELKDVRKVIIIRPNFRIGNTIMSMPLIGSIRERFPDAQIDYLAAEKMACLLENFPLRRVLTISRNYWCNPFALLGLLRILRRERYDAAVAGGGGSFTSALLTYLSGARYRIGSRRWGQGLLNVQIESGDGSHAYDKVAAFARAFGGSPQERPCYIVSEEERARALDFLRSRGLEARDARLRPFLGMFVGGHLKRRWPRDQWLALLRLLEPSGVPVAVFTGPEELGMSEEIVSLGLKNVTVMPLQSLRRTAALCAEATLIVSPDTGPMHLAAAVGVPVVAVLQVDRSLLYAPKGAHDLRLMRPAPSDVAGALAAHPLWPVLTGAGESDPEQRHTPCG